MITGASRVEQVHENLAALDVLPKLTDDVMARIDDGHRLSRMPRVAHSPASASVPGVVGGARPTAVPGASEAGPA